ncbi:MAG: hypothetical protein E7522_05080 [Ruminococcaceae bacterium]|nr:hypothetical protein [Oscillospiraceae bacterium]
MKRTLCLFLALILAVGICFSAPVTITASAAETTIIDEGNCGATGNEESVKWSLDSEGTLTISGSGAMADYNGYDMPWYNYQNYNYQNNITTIVINKGVTTIGEQAFNGCTKLIRVTIPESVTEIGKKAFTGCESLTTVTIPEGVEKIGFYAFFDCTKLTSVTIPKSVTEIGDYAFDACDALTTVKVPCSWKGETAGGKTVTKYHTYKNGKCTVANCDNACAHETITDDDVCTTCGGKYCGADKTEDKVVYFFDEGTLTITGKGAMADYTGNDMPWCNDKSAIKRVVIENGVTSIGKYSFYKCTALESVTIGDSVTSIGDNAFDGCTKLSSVTIGNAVITIGVSTFKNCTMLQTITIPNSVEKIGNGAFCGCSRLRVVTIPDSVEKIGLSAFYSCDDLTTVNVPCNWDGSIYNFAESILEFADHDTTKTATCISKAECSVCGEYGDFANHTPAESAIYTDNGDGTHGFECTFCGTVTEAHTPDANGYTVGSDGTHSFKCSGCGTVVTEPHNFENAAHQCACGKRETYSITCTETGSKGGAVRLTNTEPAIHGQTYTTQLLMPEGLQGWYTDVIKVSVNGEELVKDTDYTYDLYTVTLTVDGEKVTGNIEITYQINAKVTFVLNGGDLEPTLKDRLAFGGLHIIDDKITMPLAYGVRSSFDELNNTFIREGYICTGLKNGEQDADITAPVVNCTLSVQWQCTHNTIDENDVCTTCGGKYCGADKTKDKVVCFYDEGTATLTITGSGAMADDEMPWKDYYDIIEKIDIENGVTSIGEFAFDSCMSLTSVTIPDSVTTISDFAFCGCESLTSVTIPKSVTTIGRHAFANCTALTSVTIPKGVTAIGSNAFYYCTALTSVEIPESVETIGDYAFKYCAALTLVTIPGSETTIGKDAFYGCTKILLFVDKDNTNVKDYATDNNINYVVDGSGELEKLTFTPIYKEADNENSEITGYSVTARDKTISGALTIPSEFNGKRVTKIGNGAFANCESLTSVVIPDSVVSLGEMAFYSCGSLETVTLSSNITVIPDEAFAYCESLKTLPITEKITSIGESAFYGSGKHSKVSLSGVTIGSEAFLQCGITGLTLENCNLNDANVFINNEIEELTLSETNIPDEMFKSHSYLKTLVAENSVLGAGAFSSCLGLENVTVSGGEINNTAFMNCSSLETVTIDNIDSIGENAFCCCTALNSVVLGDGLETIEFGAFVDCNSLETIELPEGLTTIDESAFSGCKRLKKVTIPKSVTKIGVGAFEVCTSLAEVEISEGVTTIGNRAFQFCEALTKIIIPKSVTSIDAEAFYNCGNLKYIFFEGTEDSQKELGDVLVTNAKIHYGSSTHTFNENYTVDLEPTCTEKGSESQHCKYCDLTQNSKEIKENGHTSVNGGTEKAHTICDVCEEILSAEHEFASKITTEPTYTKEGIKTFTCECGYSYEEVIPCLVPGEIKAEEAESNSFSATVVDINSIVTKLQLTEEEKALIEQGADMKIVFKLSDIGATINTPEKEAIFKALTNEKIAVFLDIQLVKQIANNSVNVQKLNDLIKVTVELPSEFISKDGNVKRSYSVLRYHDGDETKVTTLNAKFDETTGTLTFETDRFSTYAIVYSDVVVSDGEGVPGTPDPGDGEVSTPENPKDETTPGIPETPKDETTPGTPETPKDDVSNDKNDDSVTNDKNDASSETGTNDKNDTSKDDVPKAGVISTTSIWLGAMALSGLGALLVSKKKKEN